MNGSLSASVSSKGRLTFTSYLQAGAVETLTITGSVVAGHLYRLTVKPETGWASPVWTVTLTDFVVETGVLSGSLNLNSALLIAWLGSTSKQVSVELWDDTANAPAGRNVSVTCDPPVQREDDVPETPTPVRTFTDDQILELIAAVGAGKPSTAKTTVLDGDGVTVWDSVAGWAGKFASWLTVWTNYLKPKADLLYSTLAHAHTSMAFKVSVAALPLSPDTDVVYRLTAADAAALAAPGEFVWTGIGWRCLGYDSAYDLGELVGAVVHALIPGMQYMGTVTGVVTSWTLAASIPGMVGVVYDNPSNFAVAVPTMTGKTSPAVSGAWDAHNGSIVTAIMEWDGRYFWASCQEGV